MKTGLATVFLGEADLDDTKTASEQKKRLGF